MTADTRPSPADVIRLEYDKDDGLWYVCHMQQRLSADARQETALRLYSVARAAYLLGLGKALELEAEVARLRAEIRDIIACNPTATHPDTIPGSLSVDDVLHAVGNASGIPALSPAYFLSVSQSRTVGITRLRHAAARLLRSTLHMSTSEIARVVAVKSHSTIINYIVKTDPQVEHIVSLATRFLEPQLSRRPGSQPQCHNSQTEQPKTDPSSPTPSWNAHPCSQPESSHASDPNTTPKSSRLKSGTAQPKACATPSSQSPQTA